MIDCSYFTHYLLCNVHVFWVKLRAMSIWNGIFFDKKLNSWFNASNKIYSCSSDRGYCEITSSRLDFSAEKGILLLFVFSVGWNVNHYFHMIISIAFYVFMCMNGWVWVHSAFEVWTLSLDWASISQGMKWFVGVLSTTNPIFCILIALTVWVIN